LCPLQLVQNWPFQILIWSVSSPTQNCSRASTFYKALPQIISRAISLVPFISSLQAKLPAVARRFHEPVFISFFHVDCFTSFQLMLTGTYKFKNWYYLG
jgi:hypothetical protein